jgi:Na+/H+ antiporter NhaC
MHIPPELDLKLVTVSHKIVRVIILLVWLWSLGAAFYQRSPGLAWISCIVWAWYFFIEDNAYYEIKMELLKKIQQEKEQAEKEVGNA